MIVLAGISLGSMNSVFCNDNVAPPQTLSIGFQTQWDEPEVDPAMYKEIFINIIDLRDMGVTLIDDEGDKFTEGVDEGTLEEMAYTMYKCLAEELDKVIPVNTDEVDTKMAFSDSALLLDVKLSGDFVVEEKRPLAQFVSDGAQAQSEENEPGKLTFECHMSDLESGQSLLSVNDTQDFFSENPRRPFANAPDKQAFISLARIWGRRVANILATQMEKKTASGQEDSSYRKLLDDFSQNSRSPEK